MRTAGKIILKMIYNTLYNYRHVCNQHTVIKNGKSERKKNTMIRKKKKKKNE